MKLIRKPLPKTRRYKLSERLRENLVGQLITTRHGRIRAQQFVVWKAHSRWVWWKFYS